MVCCAGSAAGRSTAAARTKVDENRIVRLLGFGSDSVLDRVCPLLRGRFAGIFPKVNSAVLRIAIDLQQLCGREFELLQRVE
jgi:hypothetical protein